MNYIDNQQFEKLIADYQAGKQDQVNDELGEMFVKLSRGVVLFLQYRHTEVDDQIQDAVLACFDALPKFNNKFGKAFNFFTTCIRNEQNKNYRRERSRKRHLAELRELTTSTN